MLNRLFIFLLLVRGISSWNKKNLIQTECIVSILRQDQVARVRGIKGTTEYAEPPH